MSPSGISSMKAISIPRSDDKLDQVNQLVVVAAAHHHRVDLEPLETGRLRRVETAQHLGEIADAGDLPEAVGTQRIETDVDAFDAGSAQGRRKAIELRTVGGDHQFLQTRQAASRSSNQTAF
jgi:hypothetical protein